MALPFTRVYDGILTGLREAGASGLQFAAYEYLSRWHKEQGGDPFVCWVSAETGAKVLLTNPRTFSKALRDLCSKTFATADGRRVPVLERLSGGHNGACATYRDNLYAYVVGGQSCLPTGGGVGSPNDTPTQNVENRVGSSFDTCRDVNSTPKDVHLTPPIEIEEEKSHLSSSLLRTLPIGGALRPAQSAARRHKSTLQAGTRDVDSLVSGIAGTAGPPAEETPEEPGPEEAKTLFEALAAFRAGRDLTPEQKATHERYARSRTWKDIVAGRYQGASMRMSED